MRKTTVIPYLIPSQDRITALSWTTVRPRRDVLPRHVSDWDTNMDLEFSRSVTIDVKGVLADCQLSELSVLCLSSSWHCPNTSLRGLGSSVFLTSMDTEKEQEMSLVAEGSKLAGEIRIETQLTLHSHGDGKHVSLAPRYVGSILWRDSSSTRLEGKATRFPVEMLDFTGQFPHRACWILDWNPDNLHASFLGSVRLLVNSNHEQVYGAVRDPVSRPENRAIVSAIYFDLGCALVRRALDNEEFRSEACLYEKGSVGHVLAGLMKLCFPGEPRESLYQRSRQSPGHFACELQARLRLFQND